MKLNNILNKSFLKPKKLLFMFMLLIGVALGFISFILSYTQVSNILKYNDDVYGDYTGIIKNNYSDFNGIISKFSNDNSIEYIIPFYYSEKFDNIDDDSLMYCVDNEFWKHSEFELIEGNYPQNDSEVVCEPSYLYSLGYDREDMIGAEIMFNGVYYRVSGVYTRNLLYINDDTYNHIIFSVYNSQPNALLFKLKENAIFNSDLFENDDLSIEANLNDHMKRSEQGMSSVMNLIIYIVLLISTAFIINHCITLVFRKHHKNVAVYDLIGIPKYQIWISLFSAIVKYILLGLIVASFFYGIGLSFIVIIYKNICLLSFNEILKMISFGSIIQKSILYVMILIVFVFFRSLLTIYITNSDRAKNENNIKVKLQRNKLVSKVSSFSISKRHFRIALCSNIMSIITISSVIVTFTILCFSLKDSKESLRIYSDYDYKVVPVSNFDRYTSDNINFDDFYILENPENCTDSDVEKALEKASNDFINAINESEQKFKGKQKKELDDIVGYGENQMQVVPVYVQKYKERIPVSKVSNDLKQYLSDYTDAHTDIILGNDEIPVYVKLIAFSDRELCEMSNKNPDFTLGNKKCVLFTHYSYKVNRNNQVMFNLHDKISVNSNLLEISMIKDEYLNDLVIGNDDCIVIGVSVDDYYNITQQDTPNEILISVEESMRNEISSILMSKEFVEVTDLQESIQIAKVEECQNKLFIISAVFLLVFSLFSCVMALYLRCILFEKEYATMNAIGLSAKYICSIIFGEISFIVLPEMLISLLSVGVIWKYITDLNDNFNKNDFPFSYWGISSAGVLAVSIICALLLIKKFDSVSAIELHNNV